MGDPGGGVFAGGDVMGGPMGLFLVQAIIVIMLTRLLAVGLQLVHQPRVIAEVIGGILLGPSFLGALVPGFASTIFPKSSLPMLTLVANLGLVLYLFLVGIELDPRTMLSNAKKTCLIAAFGMALPFLLGWLLAPYLYHTLLLPSLTPGDKAVELTSFNVFICVAISITAFPVLARIMNETKLLRTTVGITALGAAALDDVTAWSLLALSFALIHASEPKVSLYIILAVSAYAVLVLGVVRPLWWKVVDRVNETGSHTLQSRLLALTFVLVLASAWATEALGVHAIFGGFLVGLIMPRGHAFTLAITEKLEDIVQIVFLPLYFAASGLKTDINALHGPRSLGLLLLVLCVSVLGKLVGCGVGARMTGLGWRESLTVGVLMNTRGLVELIVLNMGLEAKVINVELFTIMVLVALITTFMTTPIVALIYPPRLRTLSPSPLPLSPSSSPLKHSLHQIDLPLHHPPSHASSSSTLLTDHSQSPSTTDLSRQNSEGPLPTPLDPWRLVLVLERLEEMPALTNLLYMLKAAPFYKEPRHTPSKASSFPSPSPFRGPSKDKESGTEAEEGSGTVWAKGGSGECMTMIEPPLPSPLAITALHFTDASSACSDMLRATMPDVAKSSDPTLYMIKVFGELVGARVSTESVVGAPSHFASHLSSRAQGAALTILPYREHRRGDSVLGDYHEKFVHAAIHKTTSPLALLLHPRCGQLAEGNTNSQSQQHGGGPTGVAHREVLLIVRCNGHDAASHANDTHALQVARRLLAGLGRGGGLHVDVLVLLDDSHDGQRRDREREGQGEERKEAQGDSDSGRERAMEEGQGEGEVAKDATSLMLQDVHALGARDITKLSPPQAGTRNGQGAALSLLRQRALLRAYDLIVFGAGPLPKGWDAPPPAPFSSFTPPHLPSRHSSSSPLGSSSGSQGPGPAPPHLHLHTSTPPPQRCLSPLSTLPPHTHSSEQASASPRFHRRARLLGGVSMVKALAEVKAPLLVLYAPSSSSSSTDPLCSSASSATDLPYETMAPQPRRHPSYAHALLTQHQSAPSLPPRPRAHAPSHLSVVPPAV